MIFNTIGAIIICIISFIVATILLKIGNIKNTSIIGLSAAIAGFVLGGFVVGALRKEKYKEVEDNYTYEIEEDDEIEDFEGCQSCKI
jgi:membrane associated rhomboid family serine protease